MRKVSLLCGLLICLQLSAQEATQRWSYRLGVGTVYRAPNSFGPELNTILRSRSSFPQIATNVAVGAVYQLNDKFGLGIQTWGVFYPKVETSIQKVTLAGVGADVNGNFQFLISENFAAALRFGVGAYQTASTISNQGFLVNRPPLFIPPGNTQTISGQVTYLDLGAEVWKLSASFIDIGLTGGYIVKVSGTDWKSSWGASVDALTPPALSLLYLRLSVALKPK